MRQLRSPLGLLRVPVMELCEGCDHEVDQCECGPMNDDWIARAYESAAVCFTPTTYDLCLMAARD